MSSENMKYALVVLNEYNWDAILHALFFSAMAFWGVKLTPKMNMDIYVRFEKFVSTLWQNRKKLLISA